MKYTCLVVGFTCLASMVHADPFEGLTRFAGVELSDEHTLQDVTQAWGDAPIVEQSDYNRLDSRICYKTAGGFVQFMSAKTSGEQTVRGFGLSEKAPIKQCVTVLPAMDPGALQLGGLRLGMSKAEYVDLTKGKTMTGEELYSARYLYGIPTPQGYTLKGQVDITPEFERGRLTAVQVWKTITR